MFTIGRLFFILSTGALMGIMFGNPDLMKQATVFSVQHVLRPIVVNMPVAVEKYFPFIISKDAMEQFVSNLTADKPTATSAEPATGTKDHDHDDHEHDHEHDHETTDEADKGEKKSEEEGEVEEGGEGDAKGLDDLFAGLGGADQEEMMQLLMQLMQDPNMLNDPKMKDNPLVQQLQGLMGGMDFGEDGDAEDETGEAASKHETTDL